MKRLFITWTALFALLSLKKEKQSFSFPRSLAIILFLSLIFVKSTVVYQPAFSKPNFEYKVHDPNVSYPSLQDVSNDSNVLFIVDFSNSMNENLNGKSKLSLALATLYDILPKIPPGVRVGLRVYGHTSGFTYLQGCMASKLLVPLGTNNRETIFSALSSTKAVGWTPITYSLKQAVNIDFAGVNGKKHIILLTDGGENCDESPCTYAIELMKIRDDVSIDVIAFDLYDYEAKNQLRCTALTTSGKFYNANNADELRDSLFESLNIDREVKGTIKVRPSGF